MANRRQAINLFPKNQDNGRYDMNASKWNPQQTRYHKQQPQPWNSRDLYLNASSNEFSSTCSSFEAIEDGLSSPTTTSSQSSWVQSTLNDSISSKYKAGSDSPAYATGSSDCVRIADGGRYCNMARSPYSQSTTDSLKTKQSRKRQELNSQPNFLPLIWEKSKGKQSDRSSLMSNLFRDIDHLYAIESDEDDDQTVWGDFSNPEKASKNAEISQEILLRQAYKMPEKKSPLTTRDVGTDTPPWLPVLPPPHLDKVDDIARKEFKNPIRRVNSCVSASNASQTSLDILIGIDENLLPQADVNKPLPPEPLCPKPVLQVAPMKRQATTAMAPYMTGIVGLDMSYPTRWDGDSRGLEENQSVLKECRPIPWLKSIIDKHREKTHNSLKAAISYPRPIAACNRGLVVNLATECGDTGGPTAAKRLGSDRSCATTTNHAHTHREKAQRNPLLNFEPQRIRNISRRPAKDSHKSSMHNWRRVLDNLATSASKLTSARRTKRDSSDLSFVCRGVASAASSGYIPSHCAGPTATITTATPIRPPTARKKPNLNLDGQDVAHRPIRTGNQDNGDWNWI